MLDEIEEKLTRIWLELIGLERVGREDDFFDLCGNSLVAMRLFERMEETFCRPINIEDLVHYPTIASMSAYLAWPGSGEAPGNPSIRVRR